MSELRKILHTDDDLDILEVSKMVLEDIGQFELLQCSSPEDALRSATKYKPDLFLLDMMMPGMTGIELLQALREIPENSDTPAIIMTARVQSSEISEYREAGANGVILKPFDPMTLADEIRSIWNGLQK